jgi:hypothetical protein
LADVVLRALLLELDEVDGFFAVDLLAELLAAELLAAELFADGPLDAEALDELFPELLDAAALRAFARCALRCTLRTGRFQPTALSARNVDGIEMTFSGLSITAAAAASAFVVVGLIMSPVSRLREMPEPVVEPVPA